MCRLIAILLAVAAQLPPAAPAPRDNVARDTSATPAATGIIRGRVTDRESGQPLARVMVVLVPGSIGEDSEAPRPSGAGFEPRITVTGAEGRFEYKRVPAGTYVVSFDPSALRGTHLPQHFGQPEPNDPMSGSRAPRLQLADGEVRNDISVGLSRSLAIEGHVLDEFGEPMANVEVSANPKAAPAQVSIGESRSTDDRGAFRLFGLGPGQYRVCASPGLRFPTTEEIRDRPMRTCYPAATLDANAEAVTVTAGDVAGIDIRVQRNRTFTITGTAIDSAGAPIGRAEINLVTFDKNGSSANGIEPKGGGQFIARAVAPGDYAVRVDIGSRFNPDDKREPEMGFASVRVDDADVTGIVVTTTKLAKVSGRIVFEDGPPEKSSRPMRVSAQTSSALRAISPWAWPSAEVRSDFTFELSGLFGPRVITVSGQPSGWVVKSVRHREDNVTDTPVEFKTGSDPGALEITLTRRGGALSGRVLDATGKGTDAAYVVLIWADPARRQFGRGPVRTMRPKPDGSFTLGTVRAGEYVILAVPPQTLMYQPFTDAEELERMVQAGERIVLAEGEKREIDLRVVKPQ